jgi:hypothetical protein
VVDSSRWLTELPPIPTAVLETMCASRATRTQDFNF